MIVHNLKNISFTWDAENKELLLTRGLVVFSIKWTEMFSLARFIIRITQKAFYRKHV